MADSVTADATRVATQDTCRKFTVMHMHIASYDLYYAVFSCKYEGTTQYI